METNVSKRKERSDIKQRDSQRKERATEGGYVRGTAISQACCCSGWEALSLGVSIATPGDVTSWPSDLVKSISLDVILFVSGSHSHSHTHTHVSKFKRYTTFTFTICSGSTNQVCNCKIWNFANRQTENALTYNATVSRLNVAQCVFGTKLSWSNTTF